LDVQDYIEYLFETYSDWKSNGTINGWLRHEGMDLRGAILTQ
jgi:hypothetical protein